LRIEGIELLFLREVHLHFRTKLGWKRWKENTYKGRRKWCGFILFALLLLNDHVETVGGEMLHKMKRQK
jgi:hypothetical protein